MVAIETIEFCHNLSVKENKNYKILSSFKTCLSDFIQIAIRYKSVKIFRKAIKVLDEIRESTITLYHKKDKKWTTMGSLCLTHPTLLFGLIH